MLGPSSSLISQILWSPRVYGHSPSVLEGPRLPAFCCSRSPSPQPSESQPFGVPQVLALSTLGDSRPSPPSSSRGRDFPNSDNQAWPCSSCHTQAILASQYTRRLWVLDLAAWLPPRAFQTGTPTRMLPTQTAPTLTLLPLLKASRLLNSTHRPTQGGSVHFLWGWR